MRNWTAQFTQLVEEVEKSVGVTPQVTQPQPHIEDTFISESIDLYKHVTELRNFLLGVKADYLLSDAYNHKDNAMTEEQRDDIDTNARIELKKYSERLTHLKNYEAKRSQSKQFFRFNKSQASAVDTYRSGVLSSLSYEMEETSKLLLHMQETRLSRKRDIELNSFDSRAMNADLSEKYNDLLMGNFQPGLEELSQEQVQLLETENGEILDAKLEELAKVEQIQSSVIEIAQLYQQLASHLTMQSESIKSLVNEQDMIELDVSEAGKLLKKATKKGNYATKVVMFMALMMGFILLFFDAVHW
jgi:syntaxin 18